MKRKLLTALALFVLVCALYTAEAATVAATGAYNAEICMTVGPQFAYQISSSDLTFDYGGEAQDITLTLTEQIIYGGDAVRVTAPVLLSLTDEQTGNTLPVSLMSGETAPEGDTAVYDFDENGELTLSITPDWTGAKTGTYTGEAVIVLAVDSASGYDYEGSDAASVEEHITLTVNVAPCVITVYANDGGIVKTAEDGEPLATDMETPYEFTLGRGETAALWFTPDEGYTVGDIVITPEDGVTREEGRLVFTQIQADTTVTLTFLPNITSIGLDAYLIEFSPDGETERLLSATIAPDAARDVPVLWTSSDTGIVSVNETGLVFIPENGSCGAAYIRCAAKTDESIYAECAVVVHSNDVMVMPDALEAIREEAFANVGAEEFILPESVQTVDARAFAGSNARLVKIMNKDIVLDADAFEDCENVTLLCTEGSNAESFAKAHGIKYILYGE